MTNLKTNKALFFLIISSCILFSVIFVHNGNPKYQYPKMTSEVFFDIYMPSYVPEGYSCKTMEIDDSFASLTFHNSDEVNLYFTQMHNPGNFSLSLHNSDRQSE